MATTRRRGRAPLLLYLFVALTALVAAFLLYLDSIISRHDRFLHQDRISRDFGFQGVALRKTAQVLNGDHRPLLSLHKPTPIGNVAYQPRDESIIKRKVHIKSSRIPPMILNQTGPGQSGHEPAGTTNLTDKLPLKPSLEYPNKGSQNDTQSGTRKPGNASLALKAYHTYIGRPITHQWGIGPGRSPENHTVRDPLVVPSNRSRKLPLTPAVEYLGLLLDAGRYYFPLEWMHNLLDYLHLLGFNLLHLRLTDDQAFNVRLKSRPELAQPAPGSGDRVYSPDELRRLVAYAKSKGIIIMPEIDVPGHAGAWAGKIPDIVVPCAEFICRKGYGIPLNVSNPGLIQIIRDVMKEIKDIFTTTPFFHLGGDEVETSLQCFEELGLEVFDYTKFENDLGRILNELDIDQSRIVRWEMTGQERTVNTTIARVKGIDHYWYTLNFQNTSVFPVPQRVFCSSYLYFDANFKDDALDIFQHTQEALRGPLTTPIAVLAGTFELSVDTWMDRNVVGRLLAVAIGASSNLDLESDFKTLYMKYCELLDLPIFICNSFGHPMSNPIAFLGIRKRLRHEKWRDNLCERLTEKQPHSNRTVFKARTITTT